MLLNQWKHHIVLCGSGQNNPDDVLINLGHTSNISVEMVRASYHSYHSLLAVLHHPLLFILMRLRML